MLPFRDANPAERFPIVTTVLIVANALIFFWELSLGRRLEEVFQVYGLIPVRLLAYPEWGKAGLAEAASPILTSMFLHGGWMHLIGNMWYLWIFGDNVEDRLGRFRFLLFYLLGGAGAGLIHVFANPGGTVPTVGASGAISAVLGAYLVTFPRARVATLIPLGFTFQIANLPAVLVLGFWFVLQLVSGAGDLARSQGGGGVAWWAHIGGFAVGMGLMVLMRPRRRRTLLP